MAISKIKINNVEHELETTIANVSGLQTALDGKANSSHTHSSYVNQNAFSNVVVGSTTIAADSATDSLTLVAGSNVTITPDATNDKITIAATDTKYTHPSYTAKSSGLYKVTVDSSGHISAATAVAKSDITGLGIPAQDTTYSAATTSADGLMTSTDKTKLNNTNIAYGTCSTAAATAAKTVTLSGNTQWSLANGSVIMVYFSNSNTASNVTINVNGTGAYPIWYNNAEYTSNGNAYTGYAKRVTTYMFNGTHWVWIASSYDSNSTYTNVGLGHGYATCSTAEATTAKVGTLSNYALTTGGIVAVKFTYAVPASATLNINSKGAKAIYHKGAAIKAGVIKAGDTATFIYNGTYYHLISIDRTDNTPSVDSNGVLIF